MRRGGKEHGEGRRRRVCKCRFESGVGEALPYARASDPEYDEVHFSKPRWFVDRMKAEYGDARTRAILEEPESDFVHIRVNRRLSSDDAVKKLFDARAHEYAPSAVGGFLVRVTPLVKSLFAEGIVTYQSSSSVLAVDALAPGGSARCWTFVPHPAAKRCMPRSSLLPL